MHDVEVEVDVGEAWIGALLRMVRLCRDGEPDAVDVEVAALRTFAAADTTGVGAAVARCADAGAAVGRTHSPSDRLALAAALKHLAGLRVDDV